MQRKTLFIRQLTEFQRAMDYELANISNTDVFLDDILIVTKGTQEKHLKQ